MGHVPLTRTTDYVPQNVKQLRYPSNTPSYIEQFSCILGPTLVKTSGNLGAKFRQVSHFGFSPLTDIDG